MPGNMTILPEAVDLHHVMSSTFPRRCASLMAVAAPHPPLRSGARQSRGACGCRRRKSRKRMTCNIRALREDAKQTLQPAQAQVIPTQAGGSGVTSGILRRQYRNLEARVCQEQVRLHLHSWDS